MSTDDLTYQILTASLNEGIPQHRIICIQAPDLPRLKFSGRCFDGRF